MIIKDLQRCITIFTAFILLISSNVVDARVYEVQRGGVYRTNNWHNRTVNVNRNVTGVNNGRYNYNGQRYNYYSNGRYYNYYNRGAYYNNCRKVAGYWSRGQWYQPTIICN